MPIFHGQKGKNKAEMGKRRIKRAKLEKEFFPGYLEF